MINWKYMNFGRSIGLSNIQAKYIGSSLILIAIILAVPTGTPEDLLNVSLAFALSWLFVKPAISMLIFTYTIIPLFLLILGIMIYPYNSGTAVRESLIKVKRATLKALNSSIFWLVLLLYMLWLIYTL